MTSTEPILIDELINRRIRLRGHFVGAVRLEGVDRLESAYQLRVRTDAGRLEETTLLESEIAGGLLEVLDEAGALVPGADLFDLVEANRIRLAFAHDPQFAVSMSGVRGLPHQIVAVYRHMLPQARLRMVLADDPGAGKTIMAGLLIKELRLRAVTIASIRGHCVGGGLVLAAACDLRLAGNSTRFSIPEVDLGIPLAWGGIPRLVREIGPAMTKELVMTCRPFTAEEGQALGFLNRVVPDEQLDGAVKELAAELAAKSPYSLSATKRAVNAASGEMLSTAGAWSDADSLLTALADPESRRAAAEYLQRLGGRRPPPDPPRPKVDSE